MDPATLLAVVLAGTPASQDAVQLRTDAYYKGIRESLDPMYRLDYELAIEKLSALEKRFPDHPGPPLSHAAALWLRELFRREELDLDRFIAPGYFTEPTDREMPAHELESFDKLVEKSQQLSEAVLEKDPGNLDARYYLGTAEGILAAFTLTIHRKKFDALGHAKKAYSYQKAIIDEDESYADAYLTVGSYEYLLDNLPWYIKWFAVIAGYTGDERLGFEYLIRAAAEGRFVETEARVLLTLLYMREYQYAYALELVQDLHHRYPENFLFHLNQGQILERMGRKNEADDLYMDVVRRAARGEPNYHKLPLGTFRYTLGIAMLESNQRDHALELFRDGAAASETPDRERALCHLEAGKLLDAAGEREQAMRHYRSVQRLADVDGSRKSATRYLEEPYIRNDR